MKTLVSYIYSLPPRTFAQIHWLLGMLAGAFFSAVWLAIMHGLTLVAIIAAIAALFSVWLSELITPDAP